MTPTADFPRLSHGGLRRRWAPFIVACIVGLGWIGAPVQGAGPSPRSPQPSIDESATAFALISAVQGFITAGESNDAAARAAYLAPDILYYGHKRTRAQASREISLLYRLWPQRTFVPTENIEVYAIPHHPGFYKVTALLEYDMLNRQNQRMTGRSRMTCVLEHDRTGVRIVGVDEQLLP